MNIKGLSEPCLPNAWGNQALENIKVPDLAGKLTAILAGVTYDMFFSGRLICFLPGLGS